MRGGAILVKRVSSISAVALVVSTASHAAVVVQWRAAYFDLQPFRDSAQVFLGLVGVSFLASVLMLIAAPRWVFRVLLVIRTFLFLGLTEPMQGRFLSALVLVDASIMEICAHEDHPISLWLSLTFLVVSLLPEVTALGATMPVAGTEVLVQAICGVSVAVCGSLFTNRNRIVKLEVQVQKLDHAVASLSDANQGFLIATRSTVERSKRDERNRITRELHDSIGYTLTNLKMMVIAARALSGVDEERQNQTLEEAAQQAQRGLEEMRRVLHLLRDKDDMEPRGIAAVQRLVATFQEATGVQVDVEYSNLPAGAHPEIDSFVYEFVQEGLTNSFRHGKATRVRLRFWKDEEGVQVVLWDNGMGTGDEPVTEGIGFLGMRERLGKLGGTLEARNVPDGFEVRASVPLGDQV